MFAVMVKQAARKRICTSGLVWVKDDRHEFYVSMKERGLWPTKAEAEKMITEPWEIAVEVHNVEFSGDAPPFGAASAGTQGYASGGGKDES